MDYDSHSLFSIGGGMIVQFVVGKGTNLEHSQYSYLYR